MRRPAQAEFNAAHKWYEQKRAGLGEEFSEEVHRVFDRILVTPKLYSCVYKDVRRAPVHRFPYAVFYQILPDRIRIIAVFHDRRDPSSWQARV
jgi:plasmid stabilization system protein ParE